MTVCTLARSCLNQRSMTRCIRRMGALPGICMTRLAVARCGLTESKTRQIAVAVMTAGTVVMCLCMDKGIRMTAGTVICARSRYDGAVIRSRCMQRIPV